MSVQLSSSASTGEQSLVLSWSNVAFFSAFHILALLAPWFFSWSALGVMLFLHWLFGSIGICLGYHRLLSHRSLRVPKPLEYTFGLWGRWHFRADPFFGWQAIAYTTPSPKTSTKIPTRRGAASGGVTFFGFCIPGQSSLTSTPIARMPLIWHAILSIPGSIAIFYFCKFPWQDFSIFWEAGLL